MQTPDSWFGRAKLAIERARSGRPGDFALIKADLLGAQPSSEVREILRGVRSYRPKIDIPTLDKLPAGTFGKVYAQWMIQEQLQPLEISDDLAQIAERNTLAVRYAATHDMVHVLIGFDTSYAGEIGVLAFAVAQNYSRQFKTGLRIASILYPILSIGKFKDISAAKHKGDQLGRNAVFLLGERLEDHFEVDLKELRDRLNINIDA